MTDPPRPRRADARRNYERLLTEAEAVFREQGAQAPLERIARRAGVAVGTLYGHFPDRRALLGTLLRDRLATLLETGEELAGHQDPGAALERWMNLVVEHAATYRSLSEQFLGSLADESSEMHAACRRMTAAGERLVARARAAGAIREDATPEDVFALINAAAWLRDHLPDRTQHARLLDIVSAGLRRAPT